MRKRALSFVLAALMLAALAVPASAAEEKKAPSVTVTTLVEPAYEDAGSFSEGLAAVKKDGKWGYIDETGEAVIDFRYDYAGRFSEGLAFVMRQDYGLIVDKTGKETPLREKSAGGDMADHLVANPDLLGDPVFREGVVIADGRAFKADGQEIVPNEQELNALADKCDSLGKQGFKETFTDESGKEVTEYAYYYRCSGTCRDGLILVDLYGEHALVSLGSALMDKTGHIVKE